VQRLRLGIQSAQVALASLAFLQVDAFIQQCMEDFALLPSGCQHFLSTGTYFLSLLVQVPVLEVDARMKRMTSFLEIVKRLVHTKTIVQKENKARSNPNIYFQSPLA
jgi:hypothetical protein